MVRTMRVVVADADRMLRDLVSGWLTQLGHQVDAVSDGRALIEACQITPDLLVSDARMAHLDALTSRSGPVPMVLMSCQWDSDQLRLAEMLGAVRLWKPLQPLELIAAVSAIRMCPPTRVLVADTDTDTADSLGWLLELLGCRVRIARNESTTEADAEQFHPHLILTDADLQKGFDVVRRIRSRRWGTAIRIAAHTGWAGEEFEQRAQKAGCDEYLVKPVSPEVLRRLIDDVSVPMSLQPTTVAVNES